MLRNFFAFLTVFLLGFSTFLAPSYAAPIDLDNIAPVKPGPPPTVYKDNWYYKVVDTKEQAENIENEWDCADRENIPLPQYGVKDVLYRGKKKFAFRSKKANGDFFQFQKPGGLTNVRTWVNKQTDVKFLERRRKVFETAGEKLGDAQGLIEVEINGEVLFIDINCPGRSPNYVDILGWIDARIEELEKSV